MAYNFDDFVSDASNVFEKIGEKVSGAIDYSKAQMDKAATRSKLKEKFTELGKLYFEAVESGGERSFGSVIAEIRELKKQIEQSGGETNSKRADKVCVFCETVSGPDYAFCPKCGEKL